MATTTATSSIQQYLGAKTDSLLGFRSPKIAKERLHLPGPDFIDRKYAHKIPFLVKFNHNELLTYPNKADQIFFGTIKQAYDMGAAAVGATIYFGSDHATRQIVEVSQAFAHAHELGMATVLWCYLRNNSSKKAKHYHPSA